MSSTNGEQGYSQTFTHRTYEAGGFLLMLSGVIGAIFGLALLFWTATGSLTVAGFTLSGAVGAVAGVVVLVFSVIEFTGGVFGYRGTNWYGSMIGGILGMVKLVTFPLDLIGTVLISLGEGHFDREGESEEVTVEDRSTDEGTAHPADD
ncbi:MAG TPA: hypothetical protein VFJ06_12065 [Halococcus sp.]|nr:hypothetical protein [Halococcus sp.]